MKIDTNEHFDAIMLVLTTSQFVAHDAFKSSHKFQSITSFSLKEEAKKNANLHGNLERVERFSFRMFPKTNETKQQLQSNSFAEVRKLLQREGDVEQEKKLLFKAQAFRNVN